MEIPIETIEFCKRLIREFPELGECVDEYNTDNGEFLPYLFLEDVRRYLFAHLDQARRIVRFLDDSIYTMGKEVEDLIAICIIEFLDHDEIDRLAEGLMESSLRKEWLKQQEWDQKIAPKLHEYHDQKKPGASDAGIG